VGAKKQNGSEFAAVFMFAGLVKRAVYQVASAFWSS
jgi:hypothetical protein